MEHILKSEIVRILNAIQRGDAPVLVENEIIPKCVETSEHKFDLVDSKDGIPIREFETGTAHYINGVENDTYSLKIICYDDFIHQFTFDDGKGHTRVSRLKDGVRVADFLIYEQSESKAIFIVHELSGEASDKKIKVARKQLSDTLMVLSRNCAICRQRIAEDLLNQREWQMALMKYTRFCQNPFSSIGGKSARINSLLLKQVLCN